MVLPYHNELEVAKFEAMLSLGKIHNSYKIMWLKAIINQIEKGQQIISFNTLAKDMFAFSYDLIKLFHLKFGGTDQILGIILNNKSSNKSEFLNSLSLQELQKLLDYVPYRLLSPFYTSQTYKKQDKYRNQLILDASNEDPMSFYKINVEKSMIVVHEVWINYIMDNITIIKQWIDFNLIMFLQNRNPSIPNIPFKVNPIQTRRLHKARKLWDQAIVVNPKLNYDIFTKHPFDEEHFKKYGQLSIDHFIPWSFVYHDELWNLSPTFKNINSLKSNNLPTLNMFDDFLQVQFEFYTTLKDFAKPNDFDDYLKVSEYLYYKNDIDYNRFHNILYDTLYPLYVIANNSGYRVIDFN